MRFRLLTLLACVTLFCVMLACLIHWRPPEGWTQHLFYVVDGGATVWREGYSESAFAKVHVGMRRAEVYALIGEPYPYPWKDVRGNTVEVWSTNASDSLYQRRAVIFNGDKVIDKEAHVTYPW